MRNFMGVTLVLIVSAIGSSDFATAANKPVKPTDAEITKALVGRWEYTDGDEKTQIKGIDQYRKDGTFTAEGRVFSNDKEVLKVSLSGTWKVSNGTIIATPTKVNPPEALPKGEKSEEDVIAIDQNQITVKTKKGKEKIYKRLAD